MKKMLLASTVVIFAACHTESPYVFDVAKMLTLGGKKIPEMFGTPYKATVPNASEIAEKGELASGDYEYLKDKYDMFVIYNYKTGVIEHVSVGKEIVGTDKSKIDINKEKQIFMER